MIVAVRLFAGLRERAGRDRVEVEVADGATIADLLGATGATPIGPVPPDTCVVAVNREYAAAGQVLRAGDEVALVPPVSGGAGAVRHVAVRPVPLRLGDLAAAVEDPAAGAVVLFQGVTREVARLEYETYAAMAEERIRAIAEQEARRHGLCAVAVEHRTGVVELSQPSVIVAASAPHRAQAFAGARAVIDRVKSEAPIWKQEVTDDGTHRRVDGVLPAVPPRVPS